MQKKGRKIFDLFLKSIIYSIEYLTEDENNGREYLYCRGRNAQIW